MIQPLVESSLRLPQSYIVAAVAALSDAFGQAFCLWVKQECGWEQVWPSNVCERTSVYQSWTDIMEQAAANNMPQLVAISGDQQLLAIPLPQNYERIVATTVCSTQEPKLLLKLAESFAREFARHEELERLYDENNEFAKQVTENFEELVFLRRMAEHMEVVEISKDVLQMAESVLPLLTQSVKAESLIILGGNKNSKNGDKSAVPVGDPVLWQGPRAVDEQICRKLVERFWQDAVKQPVVKNYFSKSDEGKNFDGVRQFILVPMVKNDQINSWLLALNRIPDYGYADEADDPRSGFEFGTAEATLLSSAASMLTTHASNVEMFRDMEKLLIDVVRALVAAIEAKDVYTCGHSERVALFAKRLGQELGLDQEECERLYLTGLLHDVGKIGVSDSTLRKPGRLTDEEFAEIQRHPESGWAILHDLDQLRYTLPGVLHHHERVDGKGYPDGLVGDEIPRDGRILAVADAFDAMTSDRPYRKGMPQEKAEEILNAGRGTQWDSKLLDVFFKIMPDITRIRESYQRPPQPTRKRPTHSATH